MTKGFLSMGPGTHKVPLELFALNRQRVVERMHDLGKKEGFVLLQGGSEVPFYDTDIQYNTFRQESYFMWAFGVTEPDYFAGIDLKSKAAYLFVPRLPEVYATWSGPVHPRSHFADKYGIAKVYYVDEIVKTLQDLNPPALHVLSGLNTDSQLHFEEPKFDGIEDFTIDRSVLMDVMGNLRVIKTNFELDVIKYVVKVSSEAHKKVMRFAKAGKTEYQCESTFMNHCYAEGGCRFVSYTCICGSGNNSAILHYGHAGAPNSRVIQEQDMCLFDMGGNYFGYCADITCSFPASGKFSPDQRMIYEAVLSANLAVAKASKPGVSWVDMHALAHRVILEKLKDGGLLKGDVDEMVNSGLGYVFQPHGLGHLMGLDVHDVAGYAKDHPARPGEQHLRSLRTARVLQKNMVLTIEPGCYFIGHLLDEASNDPKHAKFLVLKEIERFRNFGGVRIEDDVVITQDGVLNLTQVPRTCQEIEDWMAGKDC